MFETLSKMSRGDRSNTSQVYNRFHAGRNINTSYFTNAQTPTGNKERSKFDFNCKSDADDFS